MPAVSIRYPDGSVLDNTTDARIVAAALLSGSRLIGYNVQLVGYGVNVNPNDWVVYPDLMSSGNPIPLTQFLSTPQLTAATAPDTPPLAAPPPSSRHGMPGAPNPYDQYAASASIALGKTVTAAEVQNAMNAGYGQRQLSAGAWTIGEPPAFLPGTTTPNPNYVALLDYSLPVPTLLPTAQLERALAQLAPAAPPPPPDPFVLMHPVLSPVDPGSVAELQQEAPVIYRLIVDMGDRADTGATYPSCSRTNQSACNPIEFSTVAAAVQYATDHDEIPVIVPDAETAWGMVEGTIPIPTGGISAGMIGLGAAALLALLLWRRK
jgi:hypothetical protein